MNKSIVPEQSRSSHQNFSSFTVNRLVFDFWPYLLLTISPLIVLIPVLLDSAFPWVFKALLAVIILSSNLFGAWYNLGWLYRFSRRTWRFKTLSNSRIVFRYAPELEKPVTGLRLLQRC